MHRLNIVLSIVVIFHLASAGVLAQDATRLTPDRTPAKQESPEPNEILHVTDRLNQLPAARQALQDFHKARSAGRLGVPRIQSTLAPGARATFRVLKNVASNPSWEEKNFVLEASSDIAAIWVEESQLNLNHVTAEDIANLEEALLQKTPTNSIDPGQGIVANNNTYFGEPPNVDGDGRLDILLYNIEEGLESSNSFVAGFVTTQDLSPTGGGNNKDILYLDTDPGVKSRPIESVLSTAAHEYQHLIHFNYDLFETTFTNEGLSEWAEVLNGYPARNMTFLKDPATYNVRLFGWEIGDDVLDDYRRAGLFTGYLAERAPAEAVASLTRNTARGRSGYEQMLSGEGLDFESVVLDYHTANLLNHPVFDARFAYSHPAYAGVRAVYTEEIDGRSSERTPLTTTYIEAGSVEYIAWKNVSDVSFSIDTTDPFASIRDRIRVRVLLRGSDGSIRFHDLALPQDEATFQGTFDEVVMVIVHVKPELTSRVGVNYEASWTNATRGEIASISYDDGLVASEIFFSLSAAANGAVATRFELPAPRQSRLLEVQIAPFYLNQFSNTNLSSDEPRDLTLTIWAEGPDGKPGDVLFTKAVEDPLPFAFASTSLAHFTVDLEPHEFVLSRLPDVIYIGYTEAGSDANYMVVGPSLYPSADLSFVMRQNGVWGALWDTQFSNSAEDEYPLTGMVIPIRAVFEILTEPVSTEDEATIPAESVLTQNYPNPFSRSTTVSYAIARPGEVQMAVYDLLGRRIRTLVDRYHEAGSHSIVFDAESLPSGTYLYTLRTGSQSITRRMVVVR